MVADRLMGYPIGRSNVSGAFLSRRSIGIRRVVADKVTCLNA